MADTDAHLTRIKSAKATRRARFTALMSGGAGIYGTILAYRLLSGQTDIISDVVKLSGLVFIATAIAAFIWWSLITARLRGLFGGALAGLLTVLTVIPLPTFFGALKSHLSLGLELSEAIMIAAQYSISTFSLAEMLAIPPSIAVGIWAAMSAR